MTLKSNCCKFIASTFMRVLSYNRFITEQPDFLFYSQSIILNLTFSLINNLYLNLCWKVEQVQWQREWVIRILTFSLTFLTQFQDFCSSSMKRWPSIFHVSLQLDYKSSFYRKVRVNFLPLITKLCWII